MDKILVSLLGALGIGFTYWFFLMKKDKAVAVKDAVNITVDGGYSPSSIEIPLGKTTQLNFTRKDPSGCLEEIVISDFKIRKYLPLNQTVTLELKPAKTGTFEFACGMNMFHGKIVVK